MKLISWWKNISVSKKLYLVVGVMALLITTELVTLSFAMNTLSAVRAFVGGEGLWSKAQKSAVTSLQKYAVTGDEKYYQDYLEHLKVPMGDHEARMALSHQPVDFDAVSKGFIAGMNHPNDVPGMIRLVTRFHAEPHLAKSIEAWTTADSQLIELMGHGKDLHKELHKRRPSMRKISQTLEKISMLDYELTAQENEFSASLGQASRWVESVLVVILIFVVATIESTGLILTISFARGLTKVLRELTLAAHAVGEGDFSSQVPVRSKDELGQLAISLNQMTGKLREQVSERQNAEHASQTKNLFLANMSHEIRTPLNAILGFSELLRDPNLSYEERTRYADVIQRTGKSLTSIINDILDVSKVEAEEIKIETTEVNFKQMMSDIYSLLRLRSQEKGIDLRFHQKGFVSDWIKTDPTRLRQILINIIGNSIKFTDRGSVNVTFEQMGSQLLFQIQDTGAGISPEQRERLFKPFSQGDNSVRKKYGGTGLGLIISQRLAQLLGGDVGIVSTIPDKGTTFFIKVSYLPSTIDRDIPSADINQAENIDVLKNKRLLVVEDSEDNQLLANLFLSKAGAHVEFASNGREGLVKALESNYDLVLMDMQMPIMDGFTATKELRSHGFTKPIIALTGYAMREDQEKCMQAGCTAFISKPFDRAHLLNSVAHNLSL